MLNQPRLEEIMRLLSQHQRVKASELAQSMYVSEETIRRDLKYLESIGQLRRVHGGAILPQMPDEPPLQVRNRLNPQAKSRIAGKALELVEEGMRIFLDTGTSTLALAQKLVKFNQLKVVTNSLDIALLLASQSDNEVLVTPGVTRRKDNALIGPHTLTFASQYHYDIAFMGIGAVDLELGFMDYQEGEAMLRRTLVKHCRRSVILADNSKFGQRIFVNTLPFAAINTLVCNKVLPAKFTASLESHDVEILYP